MADATGPNGNPPTKNRRISAETPLAPADGGQIAKFNGDPPSRLAAMALPPSPNGQLERQVASLPPNAIPAEMCVLGSMLVDPSCISRIKNLINASDFYKPAHAQIFTEIVRCYDGNGSIDVVQLAQRLQDSDTLDSIGGDSYLCDLAVQVPSAVNAEHYAKLVRDKAGIGQALKLAVEVFATVDRNPGDLDSLIADLRIRLQDIEAYLGGRSAGTTLADDLRDPAEIADDETIPTGLAWFDRAMAAGALTRGEIVAFCGLPKIGKSAICLQLTLSALRQNEALHAVWALGEMTRAQLQIRAWAMLSGETFGILRRPDEELSARQRQAKQQGKELLESIGKRLHIVPAPFTPSSIEREALTHQAGLVVVDYLQQMQPDRPCDSRREAIDQCMSGVVRLAKQHGAAVLLISNLSKAAADSASMGTAFKESSSVGYDVDVAYLGKIDGTDDPDDPAKKVEIKWSCLGNRNGPPMSFSVLFDRHVQTFYGVADDYETQAN